MKITGIVEIDTAFINVGAFEKGLDLTLAKFREDLVQKYVEYRAGEEEATQLAATDLSPV